MTAREIIDGIERLKPSTARNSMGCSESWYDFFYAMRETFTIEEICNMNERECTMLERLATNIQDGLY